MLAIAGFSYDGPAARIGFAPKMTPEKFRAFFSAAGGWGDYEQTRDHKSQRGTIDLRWGRLRIATIELEVPGVLVDPSVTVTAASREIAAALQVDDTRAIVTLDEMIELDAGGKLEIELEWQPATA
jgi:hypothetical protein